MWTAFGFAVSAAYWPGLLAASYAPRWAVIAIGLPLLSKLDPRALLPPVAWLLFLGFAWAALSLAWTPDLLGGALDLFTLATLSVAFIAGAGLQRLTPLMTGLTLGLAASSVLCAMQAAGLEWPQQSAAPAGLFLNREVTAEFAAPVLVWAALSSRLWLAVIPAVPLILCQSRTALLATGLGFLYAWAQGLRRPSIPLAAVMGCGFGLVVLGAFYLRPETAFARLELWRTMAGAITPAGMGLGWFGATYPAAEFGHSDALQLVAELGLGASPWLAIAAIILWYGHGYRSERAMFVALCAEMAVSFPAHLPAGGFLAAIAAGYLGGTRDWIRGRRDPIRIDCGKAFRRA